MIFFGARITLEYDFMRSETNITQENKRIGLGGRVGHAVADYAVSCGYVHMRLGFPNLHKLYAYALI